MKLAILFSGQGSQYASMGVDFIDKYPKLKTRLDKLSKALDLDLYEVLNDESKINDTRYTQPAMVALQILLHDFLVEELQIKPEGYTGFSLGFLSTLYAAGVYNDISVINLVDKRALYMKEASEQTNGAMAAILNLDSSVIEAACLRVSNQDGIVVCANYNNQQQTVISGDKHKVDEVIKVLKSLGARRVMPLNVSGAFHSPLMNSASEKLEKYLPQLINRELNNIIYANSNAKILTNDAILDEIIKQVKSPVYFHQSILKMIDDGYTHFIEVGPGNVLTNLVKKINNDVFVTNFSKVEDIEKMKENLS